jgi:hypothetical protein
MTANAGGAVDESTSPIEVATSLVTLPLVCSYPNADISGLAARMPGSRKRMPKVMARSRNRGLFFTGNAGRTFLDITHPEFCRRG